MSIPKHSVLDVLHVSHIVRCLPLSPVSLLSETIVKALQERCSRPGCMGIKVRCFAFDTCKGLTGHQSSERLPAPVSPREKCAGLLFSANILGDYTEWVFHHMTGSAGHPGKIDKPADFAYRRAPRPAMLNALWLLHLQGLDIHLTQERLLAVIPVEQMQLC